MVSRLGPSRIVIDLCPEFDSCVWAPRFSSSRYYRLRLPRDRNSGSAVCPSRRAGRSSWALGVLECRGGGGMDSRSPSGVLINQTPSGESPVTKPGDPHSVPRLTERSRLFPLPLPHRRRVRREDAPWALSRVLGAIACRGFPPQTARGSSLRSGGVLLAAFLHLRLV